MSAISSLQTEVDVLAQTLNEVTLERDQLRQQQQQQQEQHPDSPTTLGEMQSVRYEERIVELHSVIAELSRKLDDERDDVIREESEYEQGDDSILEEEDAKSDILVYEDEDEDYTSLAFERAIDKHTKSLQRMKNVASNSEEGSKFSSAEMLRNSRDYESEILGLRQELLRTRGDADEAKEHLARRDKEVEDQKAAVEQLAAERDSFRRQVEDIRTTVEYQEAKMEAQASMPMPPPSRNSSERRSLRRRRNRDQVVNGSADKPRGESVPPPLPSSGTTTSSRESATPEHKVMNSRTSSLPRFQRSQISFFCLLVTLHRKYLPDWLSRDHFPH
jgi:chromosome segregation ATPase